MERISELLTVREAAELLRLREASVYQKGAAGELAVVKLGRGPTAASSSFAGEMRPEL
jgi:excisionase family DNA binding protein